MELHARDVHREEAYRARDAEVYGAGDEAVCPNRHDDKAVCGAVCPSHHNGADGEEEEDLSCECRDDDYEEEGRALMTL